MVRSSLPTEIDPSPVGPSRWATAGAVLGSALRVGLTAGLAFGWAQSAVLAGKYRLDLGLRQWADALSYSGLAHAILWTVHGLIVAAVCALAVLLCRRVRHGIAPGAMAGAVFFAGGSAFVLWPAASLHGIQMAKGLNATWCVVMACYWFGAVVGAYALSHHLAGTCLGRGAWFVARVTTWPAVVILPICLAIQWFERPRLMTDVGGWRQATSGPTDREDPRPNVVLVVLDTQRVDRLGCYGYPRKTSPHLDAFADDALVFDSCTSAAIWTLPSHASMFTGLFPSEHGSTYARLWLADGFTTLAEILDQSGYETVAFSNNPWVSDASNLSQGFERLTQPASLHRLRANSISEFLRWVMYPAGRVCGWLGALTAQDAGAKFTNQFVERWLDRRDRRRPFFLFVNYLEPHHPYRPHMPHREPFVEPNDIDASYRHCDHKVVEFSLLKRDCLSPDELQALNDTYDGETRMLDDYVGELLGVLAEHAGLDDTLVIITSDHGENLGDHHLTDHSYCVYETLAHVPLVMRYPKRLQPGRTDQPAQTIDLLPTVMDAVCGRPVLTPSTFGRSLLPPPGRRVLPTTNTHSALSSSPATRPASRTIVVERVAPRYKGLDQAHEIDVQFDRTPFEGPLRAIREGPWKYIVAADGREELYHLTDDPDEANNLIKRRPPIANRLADHLRQWLDARRPYQRSIKQGGARSLDKDARRRLRALGYL